MSAQRFAVPHLRQRKDCVYPSADCSAAYTEPEHPFQSGFDPVDVVVQHAYIAKLLAKSQWSGVLQVGTTDLDDVMPKLLFDEGNREFSNIWKHVRRPSAVVMCIAAGKLSLVDWDMLTIIGMNRCFGEVLRIIGSTIESPH